MLQNIALSFSGGGYRAAAFSLGVLSYLNHFKIKDDAGNEVPLLANAKALSTVSGGTITGVVYTHFLARGKTFDEFYDFFYRFLEEDRLLSTALAKMKDKKQWQEAYKKTSLINAFALSYKELLTPDTFDSLTPASEKLSDYCFNATDLYCGLAFRFQNNGMLGNYRWKDSAIQQDSVKGSFALADIIASSSCFPLGFEPLVIPEDYFKEGSLAYQHLKQEAGFQEGVGILDGGIVDNQGIGSLMLADQRLRREGNPGFDLILNCDVASYMMDPWIGSETAQTPKSSIKQRLSTAGSRLKSTWWLWLIMLVGLAAWLVGIGGYWPNYTLFLVTIGVFMVCFSLAGLLVKGGLLWGYNYLINKVTSIIPPFFRDKIKALEDVEIAVLRRMLTERLTSGSKMINDIFLKQIRRLNYDLLYSKIELEGRRATVLIYALTEEQFKTKASDEFDKEEENGNTVPTPSRAIFDSAKIAYSFGTTLWFTEEDRDVQRLKNVVACGQYTACHTLLKFVIRQETKDQDNDPQLQQIKANLLKDWALFNKDPFWLVG